MKINLQRKIDIEIFKAIIDLGRNTARDDIISILMLSKENESHITAEAICNELLGGRPLSMGNLLIQRCMNLELFDEKFNLTELGNSSIESQQVFLPERGLYRIICTQDPLLPEKLLDIEPLAVDTLKSDIQSEKNNRNDKENQEKGKIEFLPDWILELEGKIVNLIGSSKDQIKVNKIEKKGEYQIEENMEQLKAQLVLEDNGAANFSVSDLFTEKLKPPSISFDEVWKNLLGSKASDWDESITPNKLRFRFEELTEKELNTFLKNIKFSNPSIPNYDNFEETLVKDIPIGPKSQEDANKWAKHHLLHAIESYSFHKTYIQLVKKIKLKLPEFNLNLPSEEELTLDLRNNFLKKQERMPAYYWFIQAPLDLNPGGRLVE